MTAEPLGGGHYVVCLAHNDDRMTRTMRESSREPQRGPPTQLILPLSAGSAWLSLTSSTCHVLSTGVLLRGGTEGARVDNPDLDMTNSFFSFAEWDALRHRLTGRAFIRPFHSHSGIVFAEMIELVCRDMPDFSKVRVWTREDPTCRMSFGGCSWFLGGVGPPEISAWSQPCDDEKVIRRYGPARFFVVASGGAQVALA